jgi:hypothetical protein
VEKTKRRKRRIQFIGMALFFIGVILYALKEPVLHVPPEKVGDPPDFAFEKITISHFDMGELVLELKADYAQFDKEDDDITMKNMYGHIFRDGKAMVALSSPTASVRVSGSDMQFLEASANFTVSDQTIVLNSDKLDWISEEKLFLGEGDVRIHMNNLKVRGDSFLVNIPVRKLIVSRNGTAEIRMNNGKN